MYAIVLYVCVYVREKERGERVLQRRREARGRPERPGVVVGGWGMWV